MKIRKYTPKDRDAIEQIQFDTYLLGKSLSGIVTKREYINSEISHYLDKEPESIFVAEENGKVTGYILGCIDDKKNSEVNSAICQHLMMLLRSPFLPKEDRRYWIGKIKILLSITIGRGEEVKMKHPENAGHIHINLLPHARGKGTGTQLLNKFLKYARSKGVKIIHADSFSTRLNPNRNFWIKNGFKEYDSIMHRYGDISTLRRI